MPTKIAKTEATTKISQADITAASDQTVALQKVYAHAATSTFVAKCSHEAAAEKGARHGAKLAADVFTPSVVLTARSAARTPADVLAGLLAIANA